MGDIKNEEKLQGFKSFFRNFTAGGTSASVAVTVMAPIERVKLILQIQRSNPKLKSEDLYKGFFDASKRIVKEQGFFSFWRGNSSAVVRCFPYLSLNFSVKEKLKERFQKEADFKDHHIKRFLSNLLVGGTSGAIAIASIYPLDFARTRIATDLGRNVSERHYTSFIDCIKKTTSRDGIGGLYRGLSFSLVGVFIYRSTYFGLYDTFKEVLNSDENERSLFIAFLSAEVAATLSGIISYPFDTVRRSMMMQSGFKDENKLYKDSIECTKAIFREQGIRGFYHGSLVNILRGSGGAIMLVAFDEIQILLDNRRKQASKIGSKDEGKVEASRSPHIYVASYEDDTYEDTTTETHQYKPFERFLKLLLNSSNSNDSEPTESSEPIINNKKSKESRKGRHDRISEKRLLISC